MKETLRKLECQFTWELEKEDKLDYVHLLANIDIKIHHTQYQNHSTLYNLKAFLLQKQDQSREALESLRKAEDIIRRDYPETTDLHMLPTYGNYAWIYYHLDNFFEMYKYLDRIKNICANLQGSEYSVENAEMYAEQGWSYLASGQRNGDHARRCFERALQMSPDDENLRLGLAFSICAFLWHNNQNQEIGKKAIEYLEEILEKDPENWEAIFNLFITLKDGGNIERSLQLVENDLPTCFNPEILRRLAVTFKNIDPERAIAILKRAEVLAPDYHLLPADFGDIYFNKVFYNHSGQERENHIDKAITYYAKAIELCPNAVNPRLRLAYLYGQKGETDLQECIYKKLDSCADSLSAKCQTILWFEYGKFMGYKLKEYEKAIDMYKRSYVCGPRSDFGLKSRNKLEWHMNNYQRQGNIQKANEIASFLTDH